MPQALKAYRAALRATRIAFQYDHAVLNASRLRIKQGFQDNKNLTNLDKINEEINKLNEISKFLVKNVVQGEKQDDGRYFLKFHKQTELGDNESIKQANKVNLGSLAGSKVKKCSDIKK